MKDSPFGDKGLTCFAIIFNFWTGTFWKAKLHSGWLMRLTNSV